MLGHTVQLTNKMHVTAQPNFTVTERETKKLAAFRVGSARVNVIQSTGAWNFLQRQKEAGSTSSTNKRARSKPEINKASLARPALELFTGGCH